MKYENLNDLAEALLNQQYEILIINLVIVCFAIVGVFYITKIKKTAELKVINDNFVNVIEQQKKLAEETGEIKKSLNNESINYQIKLNAYHEKSIEAINDIYVSIIKLRDAAKDLGFNPSEEERKDFYSNISKFRNILDTKKIWLPERLSVDIESIAINIDNKANKFIRANIRAEQMINMSEEKANEVFNDQEEFYDFIYQEIKVIFDELVKNISSTIST